MESLRLSSALVENFIPGSVTSPTAVPPGLRRTLHLFPARLSSKLLV